MLRFRRSDNLLKEIAERAIADHENRKKQSKDEDDIFKVDPTKPASQVVPMLTKEEVEKRIEKDAKKPDEKQKKGGASKTDRAIKYVLESSTLFHDEFNEGYVRFSNSANAIIRVNSKDFRNLVAKMFYDKEKKALGSQAILSVISTIEGIAHYDKKSLMFRLYNRVAPDPNGNGFWYDMSNEKNQAVHITKDGWTVEDNPPILFRRYQHQIPQVMPKRGGDVKKFLDFLPPSVRREEGDNLKDSILVDLPSKFIPDIPHALQDIYGQQGATKSTLSRYEKRIVDPSSAEVLSLPTSERELVRQLVLHYLVVYDNVSWITRRISDVLSRAVTGAGTDNRQLYTDEESVIRNFKRPIILNGINEVVTDLIYLVEQSYISYHH